jgi:hypothetical protein
MLHFYLHIAHLRSQSSGNQYLGMECFRGIVVPEKEQYNKETLQSSSYGVQGTTTSHVLI